MREKNLRVRFDEITPMRILDDYNSPILFAPLYEKRFVYGNK